MEKNKQKNVELLLFVVAILGGMRVVFNKFGINNGFGPYIITATSLLIGGGILAVYSRDKIFSLNKKYFTLAVFASLLFFLSMYLTALGLVHTTPSKNVFLFQTSMIFIPFLNYFMFKQKLDTHTIIGIGIVMVGLAVLTLDKGVGNINVGDILTIASALTVAFHMTFSSFVLKKNECDAIAFTTVQMLASGVLALVLALIYEDFSNGISLAITWPLIMGGVLNGVSFYGNSLGWKYSTPTRMSIIMALIPVSGTVSAILFLGEVLTFRLFVGGGLIMAALLIIQIKPKLLKVPKIEGIKA